MRTSPSSFTTSTCSAPSISRAWRNFTRNTTPSPHSPSPSAPLRARCSSMRNGQLLRPRRREQDPSHKPPKPLGAPGPSLSGTGLAQPLVPRIPKRPSPSPAFTSSRRASSTNSKKRGFFHHRRLRAPREARRIHPRLPRRWRLLARSRPPQRPHRRRTRFGERNIF